MDASAQFKKSFTTNDVILQSVRSAGFRNVTHVECRSASQNVWVIYTPDAPRKNASKRVLDAVQDKLKSVGLAFRGYGDDGERYLIVEAGLVDLHEKAR